MSEFVKPITAEIDAPTVAGSATTVGDNQVIRAVNTNTSQQAILITVLDASDNVVGSMSLAAFGHCIIPKGRTDKIYAGSADVKLTAVTYPRG